MWCLCPTHVFVFLSFIGWHTAEVQSADTDEDEIDLVFLEQPRTVYTIPVLPNLISGKLRLKQQVH